MKAKTLDYLQLLQSRSGHLIQLKTELYWYGGRGYDGNPGRICLLLDAAADSNHHVEYASAASKHAAWAISTGNALALLLIDGSPHWVLLAEVDMELLQT